MSESFPKLQRSTQQIKKAEDGGYIVASSIEQIAEQVRETYPRFIPHLNIWSHFLKRMKGFRQTRGVDAVHSASLKSVDERENDDIFLVGTASLNLNDEQVKMKSNE